MNRSIVTTDILDEKIDFEKGSLFTGIYAEVISYDKLNRKANVRPLLKLETADGYERLPVIKLPVQTYFGNGIEIIPDYKAGEIVYLAPGIYDPSNQLKGQVESDLSLKHRIEYMLIIGAVKKQPSSLNPIMNKDGLVITDNSSMYAQFESSKIEMKVGLTPSPQKSLLGEDTVQVLKDLIDIVLGITVMTAVGLSSPVSAISANATQLNALKAQLDSLLSQGVKHN